MSGNNNQGYYNIISQEDLDKMLSTITIDNYDRTVDYFISYIMKNSKETYNQLAQVDQILFDQILFTLSTLFSSMVRNHFSDKESYDIEDYFFHIAYQKDVSVSELLLSLKTRSILEPPEIGLLGLNQYIRIKSQIMLS
jgi:hypothetical protein